jgi:hypothetical protein
MPKHHVCKSRLYGHVVALYGHVVASWNTMSFLPPCTNNKLPKCISMLRPFTPNPNVLLSLARGWGTCGSGLGLLTCVVADNSEYGQGSLSKAAGHVHFDFLDAQQSLVHIQLTCWEIMFQNDDCMDHDDDGENSSKQKRRKTESSDVVICNDESRFDYDTYYPDY